MQMGALNFYKLKLVYVDYKTASKTFSCPSRALDIMGYLQCRYTKRHSAGSNE